MAKYKAKFDHKPLSWKLFHLTVFLVLIIVFFGYFSRYIVDFLDSVDKVADNQSAAEFSQSVSEIHAKWVTNKKTKVTLHLVQSLDLKSKGEMSFLVNEFGWPMNLFINTKAKNINFKKTKKVNCEVLWLSLQSQEQLKTLRVMPMFDKKNNVTRCSYFRGENKLFDYNLTNGVVNIKVIP